ncbi:unnamed protein product [Nippostrongylus brasiliensis]|uniref:BRCT domain-containing protein n=1 Tax=Nippostrongylus brasiliensis TaxID=27835 RepID=A0A0N4YDY9_NIPBR|nr:unnamed protein product [Nippostrongylus brasiliensis]
MKAQNGEARRQDLARVDDVDDSRVHDEFNATDVPRRYAMSVPFVMLYHKKTLRKELERLFEKLGIRKLKKAYVSDISKLQLKTTLGKDMIVDKSDQSKTYFKLLNRDWA